ncbi:DUF2138 domain-containing protein [Pseudomonas aeruginosa]|uniref:DUF2138 domain-containing protein n=1 Tax=Pseudomonas aeruginosa TaxID=287 RepID=UPI0008775541|nr:DUF2138 domain-containing protein [Pseudomonas aeruginosa]
MSENNTPSPANGTPAPAAARTRSALWPVLGIVAALAAGGVLAWQMGWLERLGGGRPAEEDLGQPIGAQAPADADAPRAYRDLRKPDALIESVSLSRLPKEILEVPLLRDTLTEDFVFYYENNGDRLGLTGTLRRIIYEHDLTLKDSLVEELLDQPAQVALWRGADGRLRDFVVVLKRGGLARVLEPLAHIAADDQQLRKVGELAGTSVYRLRYGNDKAMLFLSKGDRLLLLSNPRMLFDDGGESDDSPLNAPASEDLEALLDGDELFPERFGLPGRGELRQRITLNASVLAMGYQRFIPSFAGVRFEKGEQGWSSYLALNEVERQPPLDFAPVWQAMPMGASACVALPVTPGLYGVMLERLGAEQKMAQAFSEHLSGAAGLCWYASSRLHSPLLVGQLSAPASAELDDELGKLVGRVIGAKEAKVEGGSFPVEDRVDGQTRRWTRQVSSNFGAYPASQADNPESISGRAFFRIGMARHGQTLLFSLDDQLLGKALDTLDKRYPPLAEVLPKDALVPAYLAPQPLSELLQRETLDSLPQDMEPVFRNAADTYLMPRLKTLAGKGSYALGLPAGSQANAPWQWLPLEWRSL